MWCVCCVCVGVGVSVCVCVWVCVSVCVGVCVWWGDTSEKWVKRIVGVGMVPRVHKVM